jgi:hypothetical protein
MDIPKTNTKTNTKTNSKTPNKLQIPNFNEALYIREVELVALRRVAPRSAAQWTGGRLPSC